MQSAVVAKPTIVFPPRNVGRRAAAGRLPCKKRFFTIMAPLLPQEFAMAIAVTDAPRRRTRAAACATTHRSTAPVVRNRPWWPVPARYTRARTRLARLTDLARRPTTHRPWWWCTPQVLEVLNSVPGAGSWSFNDRLNLYQLYYGDGNGDGGFVNDPIAHP